EAPARERGLVVVGALLRALGQRHLRPWHGLVGDQAQKMRKAIQARSPLVIRPHDIPGRVLRVRGLEHQVAGARVIVPALAGRQVHRTEFPLAQRVVDAGFEAALLLLVARFQPEFDQLDAAIHDVFFDLWADVEEAAMLLLSTKAHHRLHTSAVIPTAVKDNDFTRRWEMLDVALHIHLRFVAVRGGGQGYDAKDPGTDTRGDGLDGAAFASRVAP